MAANPFENVSPTASEHFKLYYYASVLHILKQMVRMSATRADAFDQFPFLIGYHNELARLGLNGLAYEDAADWWRQTLFAWENATDAHLPLRALRAAGVEHDALVLLIGIGLIEEDMRFGELYEALHGIHGQHRPIMALLSGWWHEDAESTRRHLRHLLELGLVRAVNPDAPRMEWALQVPSPIWDALRGEQITTLAPGMAYRSPEQLLALDQLIAPDQLRTMLATLPSLLESGEVETLIVRGPQHNGRRTTMGAIARGLGRGLILIDGWRQEDERRHLIAPLATLLNALPVITLDLAPAETVDIARPFGYAGPIALVLGRQGGVDGSAVERAVTITLDMPDQARRRQQWQRESDRHETEDIDLLAERFRMTHGHIHRAARIAQTQAKLNGHAALTISDVQQATRALNRQVLDTLATRLEASGSWQDLAVGAETRRELSDLEGRCRHREGLRHTVNATFAAQLNCGVRALFSGPSGTGKTLAARLLAAALQKDLYRLDLSAVVNKYIGETEKNLERVLARAEELDVILLLDEGDALLTQRTSVHTSNDRYANLETSFLLQRLESFEGIIIVTTNAGERIDNAFQRRMDVVVDFRPPDAAERWAIWQLHLPFSHAIDPRVLHDVVGRCTMTGGQIRNAVLHASLLALSNGGVIKGEYIEEAVQREYRKIGAVCPLRARSL